MGLKIIDSLSWLRITKALTGTTTTPTLTAIPSMDQPTESMAKFLLRLRHNAEMVPTASVSTATGHVPTMEEFGSGCNQLTKSICLQPQRQLEPLPQQSFTSLHQTLV